MEDHIDEPTKPGQYLAYEREKKNYSIEDVARQLYLSPHIIRALEEDVPDKLPELVYVRGYIRSYCRLLQIDPGPVLDMYQYNLPDETKAPPEDLSPRSPIDERQQQVIVLWGSIAVAAIFFVVAISWWQGDSPEEEPTEQATIPKDGTVVQFEGGFVGPTDAQSTPPGNENPEIVASEENALPLLNPVELNIKDGAASSTPSSALSETAPGDDGSDSASDISDAEQPLDAMDTGPQLVTLVVASDGRSWARVTDGSGDIIIHRILPAGYNKIFMVNLPIKFEFGNSHQVDVMIDGKDYDFSQYVRPSRAVTFEVSEVP